MPAKLLQTFEDISIAVFADIAWCTMSYQACCCSSILIAGTQCHKHASEGKLPCRPGQHVENCRSLHTVGNLHAGHDLDEVRHTDPHSILQRVGMRVIGEQDKLAPFGPHVGADISAGRAL